MKMFRWLIVLSVLFSLVSCSNTSKNDEVTDELSDTAESTDFIVDADQDELENVAEEESQLVEESQLEGESPVDEVVAIAEATESTEIADIGQYTVEKNDTLMYIAFKIYGDYGKWKMLAQMNPGMNGRLAIGQVLKYTPPAVKFEWNPKGTPYLIRQGQTLGLISADVYGQEKRWREIYDNNRPLIKNPNLIFAGFTLYYIGDRDIASESF
ncbi:MAG: LysM peptidoglycan-binding domain-containing protein [Bacteriovoracaceae bacterium]|nr:LysM peptidoglycan-binding domain-containing protein [Bacteriovoracaceae bacterium]